MLPFTHHVSISQRVLLSATTSTTTTSMSTDIPTLRAQLKAFEREFKARHDHPPSVDDIKNAGFGAISIPETDLWLITHPLVQPTNTSYTKSFPSLETPLDHCRKFYFLILPPPHAPLPRYLYPSFLDHAQSRLKQLLPPIPSLPRRTNKSRLRLPPFLVLMDLPIPSSLPKRPPSR